MKRILMVLAATLICGACVFTSCKKDEDNNLKLEEKIIGKWMVAERDGHAALTNKKAVFTFVSVTKAYQSASLNWHSGVSSIWIQNEEYDVAIDDNRVTLTTQRDEHTMSVHEFTVTAIDGSKFTANHMLIVTNDGNVVFTDEDIVRYEIVTADYSAAILGTWQGHCTSAGSVFDDGQEHRWQYNADGNFVYYVKDGDNWVPSANTLNQYFVAGNLLCTRWVDNGEEHREWWEITIDGSQMHWTALREDENGQRFTATFQMSKLN